jgi:hypothetical protein
MSARRFGSIVGPLEQPSREMAKEISPPFANDSPSTDQTVKYSSVDMSRSGLITSESQPLEPDRRLGDLMTSSSGELPSIYSTSSSSLYDIQQPPGFDIPPFNEFHDQNWLATERFRSQSLPSAFSGNHDRLPSTRSSLAELNEDSELSTYVSKLDLAKSNDNLTEQVQALPTTTMRGRESIFQAELSSVLNWLARLDARERFAALYNLFKMCNKEQAFLLTPLLEDIKKGGPVSSASTTLSQSHARHTTASRPIGEHPSNTNDNPSQPYRSSSMYPRSYAKSVRDDLPKFDRRHSSLEAHPNEQSLFTGPDFQDPRLRPSLNAHGTMYPSLQSRSRHTAGPMFDTASRLPQSSKEFPAPFAQRDIGTHRGTTYDFYAHADRWIPMSRHSVDYPLFINKYRPPFHRSSTDLAFQSRRKSNAKDRGKLPEQMDIESVRDIPTWLHSLRLHKYAPLFENMSWTEMIKLSDEELERMGMVALGARRKILKAFDMVKNQLYSHSVSCLLFVSFLLFVRGSSHERSPAGSE